MVKSKESLNKVKSTNLEELISFFQNLDIVKLYDSKIVRRSGRESVKLVLYKGDVSWGEMDQFDIEIPRDWADLGMSDADAEIFSMLGETAVMLNIKFTSSRKGDYSWETVYEEDFETASLEGIKQFFNRLVG